MLISRIQKPSFTLQRKAYKIWYNVGEVAYTEQNHLRRIMEFFEDRLRKKLNEEKCVNRT